MRATTYKIVAKGNCPACGEIDVELRFCYKPYGDDQLICVACAEQSDDFYNEMGA